MPDRFPPAHTAYDVVVEEVGDRFGGRHPSYVGGGPYYLQQHLGEQSRTIVTT